MFTGGIPLETPGNPRKIPDRDLEEFFKKFLSKCNSVQTTRRIPGYILGVVS